MILMDEGGVKLTATASESQCSRVQMCYRRWYGVVKMLYTDYRGSRIRLSVERLAHILREHPEIADMQQAIRDTLEAPLVVETSRRDPQVYLYYRWYTETSVGDKYLCVVAKVLPADAFVLTAYLTQRIRSY